jgi:ribosomal protein S12 methylthiotransferase
MIINTCGFITPAKDEAISTILETARLKQEGRLKVLLVAGCMAQRYGGELLAELPEIDGVIGTGEIGNVALFIEKAMAGERLRAVGSPEFDYNCVMPRLQATPGHWAYVKIADGCSNRCSYCAIPGIRGNYRSRPLEVLEDEVAGLAARGVKEIILVAQDTTAYGADIYGRPRLAELLERLAGKGVPWVRVMYCYPAGFSPELIRVIGEEENICKYIDLPIQHINNIILKKMNRRGTGDDIRRLIDSLRASIPGLTLRTTLMVGFPGEGEAEFGELYNFVRETRFERLGVFKFCPEEGTPACLMTGAVPDAVKEHRFNRLMALQKEISLSLNRLKINTPVRVLVDGKKRERANFYYGRTMGDAPEVDGSVLFAAGPKRVSPGEFVQVLVTRAFDYGLRGVLAP